MNGLRWGGRGFSDNGLTVSGCYTERERERERYS